VPSTGFDHSSQFKLTACPPIICENHFATLSFPSAQTFSVAGENGREAPMIDEQQMIRTLLAEQVRMLGYIQSIVRRPELADDIFQDVCAVAVEKRGQIKNETHLRNWLRTTARLEALTALRKRRADHVAMDPALLDVLDCTWRDEELADSSAYGDSLRQCLKLLSKPHQALVNRRFYENCDYDRLAVELNRPVDSLYVTFSRIYATLGKCIAGRLEA
jgi:RNA polymerase sigma factor (sigma-70 family)